MDTTNQEEGSLLHPDWQPLGQESLLSPIVEVLKPKQDVM